VIQKFAIWRETCFRGMFGWCVGEDREGRAESSRYVVAGKHVQLGWVYIAPAVPHSSHNPPSSPSSSSSLNAQLAGRDGLPFRPLRDALRMVCSPFKPAKTLLLIPSDAIRPHRGPNSVVVTGTFDQV
jgi:hypothetical protein